MKNEVIVLDVTEDFKTTTTIKLKNTYNFKSYKFVA